MAKTKKNAGTKTDAGSKTGIVFKDPQEIIPEKLPLVVEVGEDANEAQIAFAKTLNVYAYKNPRKFKAKKKELMAQLERLAEEPGYLTVLIGAQDEAGTVQINANQSVPGEDEGDNE